MKAEAKRSRSQLQAASEVDALVTHMGQQVAQLSFELDNTPELLIEYPLRQFFTTLKKFVAALETLSTKLEYAPLYEEHHQQLLDKIAECERQQQEIAYLREQLYAVRGYDVARQSEGNHA